MEIAGIGTEIVECLRIRRMIEEHGEQFLMRVYTEAEINFCRTRRHSTEQFAAHWAVKEAVLKCFSLPSRAGAALADIETESDDTGTVKTILRGGLRGIMTQRGIEDVLVTMSFCRAYATATAIALRKPVSSP